MPNPDPPENSYFVLIPLVLVCFLLFIGGLYYFKTNTSIVNCIASTFSDLFENLLKADLTNSHNVSDFQQQITTLSCSTSTIVNIQIKQMLTDLLNALVILQTTVENDATTIQNTQQNITKLQTQLSSYVSQNCLYTVPQNGGGTIFFVALPLVGNWWPGQFTIPSGIYTGIELVYALNASNGKNWFIFTYDATHVLITISLRTTSNLQGFYCYEATSTPSLAKLLHFFEPENTPSNHMNASYTTTITSMSPPTCYITK
jgi:hypothetical protein